MIGEVLALRVELYELLNFISYFRFGLLMVRITENVVMVLQTRRQITSSLFGTAHTDHLLSDPPQAPFCHFICLYLIYSYGRLLPHFFPPHLTLAILLWRTIFIYLNRVNCMDIFFIAFQHKVVKFSCPLVTAKHVFSTGIYMVLVYVLV